MSGKVLSVGQCRADHSRISSVFRYSLGAEVVAASTAGEAMQLLRQEPFSLVLVNRLFDGDGDSGLELIRRVKADEQAATVPIMLVSNYEDAQVEAVAAGAQRGFGKAALQSPATIQLLRAYL